jgi:outer membrane protein
MRLDKNFISARFAELTMLRLVAVALVMGVAWTGGASAVSAETLRSALAAAYMTNPTLNAERAKLRAIDEKASQARSNFRPSISADLDTGYLKGKPNPVDGTPASTGGFSAGGTNHPTGYTLTIDKTLFRGFRTLNAIRQADADIQSGREDLRAVEQLTLLDAVTSYMDVVRDQAIVRLREGNVRVLSEQLKATEDRFEVGEVTRTDVAQAEARRSGSNSQLSLAQSNVKTSRASYQRVIGHPAGNVVEPSPIDSLLPHALPSALDTAEVENPALQSAIHAEEASRYAIKQIRGEMLPEISVEATYSDTLDPSVALDRIEETTLFGRIRVPLYSQGEPSSRVRAAVETNRQRKQQVDEARAQAVAIVIAAWGRLVSSRAQIISDQSQVKANNIALNGVKEEEKVGQRTILDVLDAEQEFLDAQVTLVTTKRDKVVASFILLSAIGRLDTGHMRLSVEEYDPTVHYNAVKNKWFGTNTDRPGLFGRGGSRRNRGVYGR